MLPRPPMTWLPLRSHPLFRDQPQRQSWVEERTPVARRTRRREREPPGSTRPGVRRPTSRSPVRSGRQVAPRPASPAERPPRRPCRRPARLPRRRGRGRRSGAVTAVPRSRRAMLAPELRAAARAVVAAAAPARAARGRSPGRGGPTGVEEPGSGGAAPRHRADEPSRHEARVRAAQRAETSRRARNRPKEPPRTHMGVDVIAAVSDRSWPLRAVDTLGGRRRERQRSCPPSARQYQRVIHNRPHSSTLSHRSCR